ncbi:MAG: hydrogenase expression/formation protein HypE [Candidatus Hodarchaeota archaeon]
MLNLDANRITMAHGAGGTVMQDLINNYILKYLGGSKAEVPLEALDDSAVIDGIILKSDSHTVKPLFFPGGDIGSMSVAGTVNDISMVGGESIALAAGFVIEEGFPMNDLERILKSMQYSCKEAEVYIITGDTKVIEKGGLDKFVINTSGIGRRSEALDSNILEVRKHREFNERWILDSNLREGDKIIVSGTVGDHGVALLSFREGYGFGSRIVSDVAPLNKMVMRILEVGGIVSMKDPTRGGLSNLLNEWSDKSHAGILVYEEEIPMKEGVRSACEMMGIDPLEIGNEGKAVIGVIPQKAEEVLSVLREDPRGREARIIGEVTKEFRDVVIETSVGGRRILSPPIGDPIPRIC